MVGRTFGREGTVCHHYSHYLRQMSSGILIAVWEGLDARVGRGSRGQRHKAAIMAWIDTGHQHRAVARWQGSPKRLSQNRLKYNVGTQCGPTPFVMEWECPHSEPRHEWVTKQHYDIPLQR